MSHTCHAHGCAERVPPRMFACRRHWYALPKPIRDAVWREYRDGQEVDKRPSVRYLAVQRFAVAFTAFKPNDKEAAKTTAGYLSEAILYAKTAMMHGLGNPLEGLPGVKEWRRR